MLRHIGRRWLGVIVLKAPITSDAPRPMTFRQRCGALTTETSPGGDGGGTEVSQGHCAEPLTAHRHPEPVPLYNAISLAATVIDAESWLFSFRRGRP